MLIRMKTINILILLYTPTGRDPEAMIPLAWYLENVFGYKISFCSVFDGIYMVDKIKPEVLLFSNISGARPNVEVANYAYKRGVKVITLTSEGLFRKEEMDSFIWGNNWEKSLNWHKMFVWSKHFLKMTREFLPEYKDTFDVSGNTGLDRYKIYQFSSREDFLKKYHKEEYKKVIFYAGFSFSYFFIESGAKKNKVKDEEIKFFQEEMNRVKKILLELIKINKDILFILKKHPAESDLHMEIDRDWSFDNILIFQNEEPLADLINISDFCFVYRSTVTFETYALGKAVVNIFPSEHISYKQEDQQGNVHIKNYVQAQKIINEYYKKGEIFEFENKKGLRKKLIEEKVGSIDGLNSFRTAKKINKFIKEKKASLQKSYSLMGLLIHLILKFNIFLKVLTRFRNSEILKKYNDFYLFNNLCKKYFPQIKRHYDKIIKPFYNE